VRTEALGHHLNGTALEAALRMAECRLDQGESDLALTLLEEAAAGVAPDEHPLGAAIALLQSLAHASRGDLAEAIAAARTGIDAARDAGMLYELGLLLVVVADLTTATDATGAAAAAVEGQALLETLGIGRIELTDSVV
jgi:thioredoxin-like negative regulator of GroEL